MAHSVTEHVWSLLDFFVALHGRVERDEDRLECGSAPGSDYTAIECSIFTWNMIYMHIPGFR